MQRSIVGDFSTRRLVVTQTLRVLSECDSSEVLGFIGDVLTLEESDFQPAESNGLQF
jgi:hypothetical protein